MIKFRRRHARVIVDQLSLHPRVYCTSKSMDATIGNTRIRGVHTPTRIHNHPNGIQLRMRRPKNILISIKKQSSRIEVVLRVLGVPDLVLERRFLRGASRSLDAVRTASKSNKKPPTAIFPGDDARRWREGAAAPRDAEIVPITPWPLYIVRTSRRTGP